MFASFENLISNFFNENEDFLKSNYPGLPLRRLMEEAKIFLEKNLHHSIHSSDIILKTSLSSFFKELKTSKPLEHIIGKSYFFDSYFQVSKDVLIPRFETEILVDYVLKLSSVQKKKLTILDLGTGSGNILITLAQKTEQNHSFIGVDICKKALKIAKRNLFFLGHTICPQKKVEFRESNLLEAIPEKVDLIVSNPPYYKSEKDLEIVHNQVKRFEPTSAVFIDDEMFETWYHHFFKQCYNTLSNSGDLILESDSTYLPLLKDIARTYHFSLMKSFSDLNQRERFLHFKKDN